MTAEQRNELSELIKLLEKLLDILKRKGRPRANWEKVLQELISCMENNDQDEEVINALISLIRELIEHIRKLNTSLQLLQKTVQKKKSEDIKKPPIEKKQEYKGSKQKPQDKGSTRKR